MSRRYPMEMTPKGWYRVADASRLAADEPLALHYFGRDLVAFRGADGQPRVFDAHCPHLGANLAVGGEVEGGQITCPFHRWSFDGAGRCTGIPYTERIPAGVSLHSYPARELNGLVVVWFDPAGNAPPWEIPEIPGWDDEVDWTGWAARTWHIAAHIQEVVENVADAPHQQTLHSGVVVPEIAVRPDEHVLEVEVRGRYAAGSETGMDAVDTQASYRVIGMGINHGSTQILLDGQTVERQIHFCFTPVDEDQMELTMYQRTASTGDDALTAMLHEAMVPSYFAAIDEDVPIWEHKVYRSLPGQVLAEQGTGPAHLCDVEGEIAKVRVWSRQFYPSERSGV